MIDAITTVSIPSMAACFAAAACALLSLVVAVQRAPAGNVMFWNLLAVFWGLIAMVLD